MFFSMNIEHLNQQIVINEWQLGQQLNTAVHSGARDKFNLLLSFLSDDARDFAQFEIKSEEDLLKKPTDLRTYFELPNAQPLVNEGPSEKLLVELNDDLQQKKLIDIRFKQLITNEALLSKQQGAQFPEELLDNLPLLKKQRMNAAYQSNSLTEERDSKKPIGVDVGLLDEYKNMDLVNRPLQVHYK